MRDTTRLHPKVQALAVKLVSECDKVGLHIKITDCVRSMEEQNGINASRTKCKYPNSYHNWGLAFDFCRNDGTGAYNDSDGFFRKVGQVGKSIGLFWGGDFESFHDGPHMEYHGLGLRSQIEHKYGTPENFFDSWKTTKPTKTVTKDSPKDEIRWLQGKLGIETDGIYGNLTKTAVLSLWKSLGWNKDGKDKGDRVGIKTINKLDSGTK